MNVVLIFMENRLGLGTRAKVRKCKGAIFGRHGYCTEYLRN